MHMTVWVEQTEDERVIHGDADGLLHVAGRVLGHAYDGVHIHPAGTLITSGIIGKWLRIDTGGALYSSGLVGAQPHIAPGSLLDIRGQLTVPRLPRELPGVILLAVAPATSTSSSDKTAPSHHAPRTKAACPRKPRPATASPVVAATGVLMQELGCRRHAGDSPRSPTTVPAKASVSNLLVRAACCGTLTREFPSPPL